MRCLDDDAWYQKIISKTKITLYVVTAYERKIHCPQNRKVQTCQFHRSASSRRASGNVFKSQRSRTRRFTLSLSRQPVTWQKKTQAKNAKKSLGFFGQICVKILRIAYSRFSLSHSDVDPSTKGSLTQNQIHIPAGFMYICIYTKRFSHFR